MASSKFDGTGDWELKPEGSAGSARSRCRSAKVLYHSCNQTGAWYGIEIYYGTSHLTMFLAAQAYIHSLPRAESDGGMEI